jgi:hypothetical protein
MVFRWKISVDGTADKIKIVTGHLTEERIPCRCLVIMVVTENYLWVPWTNSLTVEWRRDATAMDANLVNGRMIDFQISKKDYLCSFHTMGEGQTLSRCSLPRPVTVTLSPVD